MQVCSPSASWFQPSCTYWTLVLVVILLVFYIISYLDSRRKGKNKRAELYPPGPPPFPLLGNIPHLFSWSLTKIFPKWSKLGHDYGNLLSIYMGPQLTVTASDPKILREAFNNPHVNGRPFVDIVKIIHDDKVRGLGIQSGETWRELNVFVVTQLNEYRLGGSKTNFEKILQREARELRSKLGEMTETPISTSELFQMSVANVIWEILGSQRFDLDDSDMKKLTLGLSSLDTYVGSAFLELFFPRLSNWVSSISYRQEILQILENNVKFAQNFVQERQINYHLNRGVKNDLCQAFLEKIGQTTEEGLENSAFYGEVGYENLAGVVRDLLLAGTETATKTMCWLLFYLALHPQVQQKVHEEIDSILQGRFPSLQDKERMPYMDATLHETLRKSSVIPMGVPHCTTEDTFVRGYFIPKGTPVASNIYAIHNDPGVWTDPENFRPERFFSTAPEDGEEKNKVAKHESFVAFSVGKRRCPGKSLAFSILFMFATSILQQFSVSLEPHPTRAPPSMEARISPELKPPPHKLVLSPRES